MTETSTGKLKWRKGEHELRDGVGDSCSSLMTRVCVCVWACACVHVHTKTHTYTPGRERGEGATHIPILSASDKECTAPGE